MNKQFFSLPENKRKAIINAGLRAFSEHGYRKCPMNEIASQAGISKSLLFYYFKNKKEFYLYLVRYSREVTGQEMAKRSCYKADNIFDVFLNGLTVKADMLRSCPELALFEMKAYFEKDPETAADVEKMISGYSGFETQSGYMDIDPARYAEGLDAEMIYREIYLASEGYLWEKLYKGSLDPDEMERDFKKMAEFWKKAFLRREEGE